MRLTTSGGVSWTAYSGARSIAAGPGGILLVSWFDDRDGNYEVYCKRSTDLGISWADDVRLTNDPADSYHPAVAASDADFHVVWWDERNGLNSEIYYKRSTDAGATWSEDIRLTNDSAKSHFPSIAAGDSCVHVVWWDERTGWDVYYKHSTDRGLTWSGDMQLTTDPGLSMWPSIAVAGSDVHVAWFDNRNGTEEIYYKHSTDNGQTWSADIRLTDNPRFSEYPSIAAQGQEVHVAWSDDRDGNWEVYYKRSTDGGFTWSDDTRLTNAPSSGQSASIAAQDSDVHLVWADSRDGYWAEVYYLHSTDRGGSWLPDVRLTTELMASERPTVCLSGSGVHVAWMDDRDAADWEIYYKRNPTGTAVAEGATREERGTTSRGSTIVRGVLLLPEASSHRPQAGSWLLDASGRKVMALHPGANDVRHLAAGVYFVRAADGNVRPGNKVLIGR